MAQLIALIYKDQHVNTLQKLLNQWLETCMSESSEENESNGSPPNQGYTNIIPLENGNFTLSSYCFMELCSTYIKQIYTANKSIFNFNRFL